MNAHTPGPWVVGNGGNPHGAEFEVRSADKNDIYITGVQWASPGDPEEGYMPSFAQARANAVPFAAAPDLLAAAQKALNYIANTEGELGITFDSGDALRASIARATARVGGAGA